MPKTLWDRYCELCDGCFVPIVLLGAVAVVAALIATFCVLARG